MSTQIEKQKWKDTLNEIIKKVIYPDDADWNMNVQENTMTYKSTGHLHYRIAEAIKESFSHQLDEVIEGVEKIDIPQFAVQDGDYSGQSKVIQGDFSAGFQSMRGHVLSLLTSYKEKR